MPLIKACLLPHSPLLIPEIGRSNHGFLQKTLTAYQKIKNDLIAVGAETLIIISPHGHLQEDSFLINCAPEMEISFQDFGFIPSKTLIKGDVLLADQLKNELKADWPLRSLSETRLDHGSAIPLYLFRDTEAGKKSDNPWKSLIIFPAEKLNLDSLFEFGKKVGSLLTASPKKIGLIASGDLSHRLKRNAPGGYSPKGPKFDNKLIEYLSVPETAWENIIKFDQRLVLGASECGLRPIVILLGIIAELSWEPDILAYQTDFGVGYLSLDFLLK